MDYQHQSYSSKSRLVAQIREMILQAKAHDKLPTARELCAQFGVSAKTLNAALQELEAQGFIDRIHSVGIFVRERRTRTVLVAFEETWFIESESPFWKLLWRHLQDVLTRSDLKPQLFLWSEGDEKSQNALCNAIRERQYDGILAVGSDVKSAQLAASLEVPYVAYAGEGEWAVFTDAEETVSLSLRALQSKGCQTVGLWLPARADSAFSAMVEDNICKIFRFDVQVFGLKTQENWIQCPRLVLDDVPPSSREQGAQMTRRALQRQEEWPQGIVVTDDTLTLGILEELAKSSIQVGRDLQIATHANAGSPLLQPYEDNLICVETNPAQIAQTMLDVLQRLINGENSAVRRYFVSQTVRGL